MFPEIPMDVIIVYLILGSALGREGNRELPFTTGRHTQHEHINTEVKLAAS